MAQKNSSKLVVAFVISSVGILASYEFSKFTGAIDDQGDPVAILDYAVKEVQKKSAKRIIWYSIGEQASLFPGDSIRTGSEAEAKIKFSNGTVVELDPESVVTLAPDGKASLDFIKGNLYVRVAGKDSNVQVRANGSNIDVSNADLALGKNDCGADVQVVRGSANLEVDGKAMQVDRDKAANTNCFKFNQSQIKVKSPAPNDRRFARIDKQEPQFFEFEPVSEEYDIHLEWGTKRDLLVEPKDGEKVPGKKGLLKAQLKPGIIYFRLVGVSKTDPKKIVASIPQKLTVVAEAPPKLLEPAEKSVVVLSQQNPQISFRWSNPSKLEKQTLEIALDSQFKQPVEVPEVEDQTSFFADLQKDGNYYWRVSGFRQGDSRVHLTSATGQFTLKSKFELIPPNLKVPVADAQVPFEVVSTGGLFLSWETVPGVTRYQAVVKSAPGKEEAKIILDKTVADQTQVRVPTLQPGWYSWNVFSLDQENKRSGPSATRKFLVQEIPKLLFTDGKDFEQYQYTSPKPSLRSAWQKVPGASKYKVSIRSSMAAQTQELETADQVVDKEVPADGGYGVTVEAMDDKGRVLARSTVRQVRVEPKPLLPPPQYADSLPQTLSATRRGVANLSWRPVNGAKNYVVQLKTGSGAVAKEEKFNGTAVTLKNLLPGEYNLSLSSVDEHGRMGPQSETRKLVVPDLSDVKAPKFKGVKIQ